jgi:HD superfamily phosphohydrolase
VEVVLSEATEIGQLLRSYSSELPTKVAAIIEGKFQPAALAQLVSSQLDVDRMDYLLRDSLMTGAKYGIYDLKWIINAPDAKCEAWMKLEVVELSLFPGVRSQGADV